VNKYLTTLTTMAVINPPKWTADLHAHRDAMLQVIFDGATKLRAADPGDTRSAASTTTTAGSFQITWKGRFREKDDALERGCGLFNEDWTAAISSCRDKSRNYHDSRGDATLL